MVRNVLVDYEFTTNADGKVVAERNAKADEDKAKADAEKAAKEKAEKEKAEKEKADKEKAEKEKAEANKKTYAYAINVSLLMMRRVRELLNMLIQWLLIVVKKLMKRL